MKRNIKIDENYFLISQKVMKEVVTTQPKSTNHIFIVDVSGSMYYDLPLIRKQLKNKLSNLMREGDTITIIWFSGKNDSGVLKEEVEVKSLKTLTDLHEAIDKWLRPVGLTAFLKPLQLVKDIISRISENRPDSVFSMIFLTDGYNNDCPWNEVISTLKTLENEIASSTFVEYGYYADTQKLTQMASIMGGEKISTSDFDEFEPVFDKKISSVLTSTKKVEVSVSDDYLYDFAFSVDENGSVLLYNINNNKILVGNSVDQVYFFSSNGVGDSEIGETLNSDRVLYSAIYVLSDKLMNFEAEKIFYALGDNFYYKELVNAFGKQKLNAFKNNIKACISDMSIRFPEGRQTIAPVSDDAYCLMNLISDLGTLQNCLFYPNHEEFVYNRIGRKMKAKGSDLSDKDKQRLAEAKNVEEANKILEELKETNVELKFTNTNPDRGYPVTDLVWNESRANLSMRIKIDGVVELPENKFDINEITSYKYNTFTLIKDGIVNVEKLPLSWSQELDDLLMENNVEFNRSTVYDSEQQIHMRYIIINLKSLPVINRGMVKNISAVELAKNEWELNKLQGENKVYGYYRKELFPKTSKTFAEALGDDAAQWLKEIGITDYNGFAPKREAEESTDSYMAVNLDTKIAGLSSLPKVDVVVNKIKEGKELKINEWVMSHAILNIKKQIDSDIFQTLSKEQQIEMLKTFITTKSIDMNKRKREVMQEIAQIKFSLILSKKWFNEFKSFDDNKLNIDIDDKPLSFTFQLSEKEVKI